MQSIEARGFLLSSFAYGEADKIVQLYTSQLGKVKAVAKGARKPKSKLAPALDLFNESGFSLYKKRPSGDLYVLGQVKVVDDHSELKKDLASITALQVLADMLIQSIHDTEPHPEVYSLLKGVLKWMGEKPESQELYLAAFGVQLLDLLGHPLELAVCTECGASLEGKRAHLIPHRGGALCEDCCPSGPARLRISPAGLAMSRKLKELPVERVHVLKPKPALSRELFLVLSAYLEQTVEKQLKTVDYYLKLMPTPL